MVELGNGIDVIPNGDGFVDFPIVAPQYGREKLLAKALSRLVETRRWDLIVVDTPGAMDLATVNALVACDEILVPVEAKFASIDPTVLVLRAIEETAQMVETPLSICGLLPTLTIDQTRISRSVVAELRETFGSLVFKSAVRHNITVAEAPASQQSVVEYDSRSNGAVDYRAVTAELVERLHLGPEARLRVGNE